MYLIQLSISQYSCLIAFISIVQTEVVSQTDRDIGILERKTVLCSLCRAGSRGLVEQLSTSISLFVTKGTEK